MTRITCFKITYISTNSSPAKSAIQLTAMHFVFCHSTTNKKNENVLNAYSVPSSGQRAVLFMFLTFSFWQPC